MQPVFLYEDYKTFILDRIGSAPGNGRGQRKRIAEAIGCQTAYVSHVLAGERDFSLEQAEALARFFKLKADETEFLFLLVERARAGTASLRGFLERKLSEKRLQFTELAGRVKPQAKVSDENRAIYYGSWHYQAVRVALSLPHCRMAKAIAKEVRLPLGRVESVLRFLVEANLAREENGKFFSASARLHLSNDAPEIAKFHTNWRLHSIQNLDNQPGGGFHYSGVVSLSRADYDKVQEILRKAVVDSLAVVHPSKEERLAVMQVDFYGMRS